MTNASTATDLRKQSYQLLEKLYSAAIEHWPGFQVRKAQKDMMVQALEALVSHSQPNPLPGGHIALIEGQTGTGKTIGYLLPLLAVSIASGKPGVVSTATVALQEQLNDRDLPNLAKVAQAAGVELKFALIKGMQRFVCREHLLQACEADDGSPSTAQTVKVFHSLRQALDDGSWNGDRDVWPEAIPPSAWSAVEVERATCTGKSCPSYERCGFQNSRKGRRGAQLLVTNHSLVLAYLASQVPTFDPTKMLFVFDEGHHLPEIGTDHFSARHALMGSGKHLGRIGTAMSAASQSVPACGRFADSVRSARLRLQDLGRTSAAIYGALDESRPAPPKRWRLPKGVVPSALREHLRVAHRLVAEILPTATDMLLELKQIEGNRDRKLQQLINDVGRGAETLERMQRLATAWLHEGRVPKAKWVEEQGRDLVLCASDLTAASSLRSMLWNKASGAVVTSATLTACGDFSYFEAVSGLKGLEGTRKLITQSPFDYEKQARLIVPHMRSTPKQADAFQQEVLAKLAEELPRHRTGQLVLFASKRQMDAVFSGLPSQLQQLILRQGDQPKSAILKVHRERIAAGRPSIIFGMQSFGEGVDLPGELLEYLYIDKVPFSPPDSVIDEALAEWLESQNRDTFTEVTLPKASQRLAQWTGRGIRSTTDRATIYVFDVRLVTKDYGRSILKGLPPIPVVRELE